MMYSPEEYLMHSFGGFLEHIYLAATVHVAIHSVISFADPLQYAGLGDDEAVNLHRITV